MLKNLQVVIYSKLPKKNHVIMCNLMNNMPEKITAITNILTVSACFLLYSSDLLKHFVCQAFTTPTHSNHSVKNLGMCDDRFYTIKAFYRKLRLQ